MFMSLKNYLDPGIITKISGPKRRDGEEGLDGGRELRNSKCSTTKKIRKTEKKSKIRVAIKRSF